MALVTKFAVVLGATVSLVLVLSGCAPGPSRPAPEKVVEQYLDAIADGDASLANDLGGDAPGADSGTTAMLESSSFLTDEVLSAATERIANVRIVRVDDRGDIADVTASFSLGAKTYEHALTVKWDDTSGSWTLEGAVTGVFEVYAQTDIAHQTPLDFTLAGTAPKAISSDDVPLYDFVAYPAVYPLHVDLGGMTLVDPAKGPVSRDLIVGWNPGSADAIVFEVTG